MTLIARLWEKWGRFHCEAAMYGRENNLVDCAWEPRNVLPGWNERSGWSVLVNGRPVEGRLTVINPDDPETLILRFPLWPDGQPVDLKPGVIARVTGVVPTTPVTGARRRRNPSRLRDRRPAGFHASACSAGDSERCLARLGQRHLLCPAARPRGLVGGSVPGSGPLVR